MDSSRGASDTRLQGATQTKCTQCHEIALIPAFSSVCDACHKDPTRGPPRDPCPECQDRSDIHYNHCSKYVPKTEEPDPMPTAPPSDAGAALWQIMGPAARPALEEIAREAAKAAAAEVASKTITIDWVAPDGTIKISLEGGEHAAVKDIAERHAMGFRNFMLVGPAGSGKSTIGRSLAKALNVPYAFLGFNEDMPAWRLEGRKTPNVVGQESTYEPSPITDAYQIASVIMLDDADSASANTLCVLLEATSNGHWATPGGVIARHADNVILLSANTYGQGADRVYAGRNQLDGAFLNRFAGCVLTVDYDRELETRLVSGVKQAAQVLAKAWHVRERVNALKLRRIFGTRDLLAMARFVQGGWTVGKALDACLEGWTADERSKVAA